tara:strand:+ start:894 stop:1232 length:339 start_codon:yes stop_codon:yes gene_type:complete
MNIDRIAHQGIEIKSTRVDPARKKVDLAVTDVARDIVPETHENLVNSSPEIQSLLTPEEVNALSETFFDHRQLEIREIEIESKASAGMYNLRGESASQNRMNTRGLLLDIVG